MGLSLRDIRHRYGALEAVTGASLDVAAGEIVCLFGPSGCGKTTLLRLVAGLERLQAGTVTVDGVALSGGGVMVPPERRPIGIVFQDYVLFPHMTAAENIAFGLASASPSERASRVADALASADLADLADRYPHELSGGQQQRVALARAFVRNPRAMLLDEPFASIDSVLRRRLREEMRRILKENGAATVLVTHDPEEALALGDRIAVMRAGRIIEVAPPQDLFERPATPEGAGLFAGAQRLEGEARGGVVRTFFGEFSAGAIADGRVDIVALAGAVDAAQSHSGLLQSLGSRYLGPGWRVEFPQHDGRAVLWAMSASEIPKGARAEVRIEPALVRVFPLGA